jgi:deazaflavin-dependent oxidoreductase (nitroreductase family)
MPSDFAMKTMNAVHRGILAASFGKFGWSAAGMPVIELTTTGRRSGEPRSCLLTSPLQLDDAYVIVASRGGDDRHPAWFLNLEANPGVEVAVGGAAKKPYVARVVDDAERDELWPRITAKYRNYAGYQKKTERRIPVVILEPAS